MEVAAPENRATASLDRGAAPRHLSFSAFRLVSVAAFLLTLWFGLCKHLSSEWSINEQYSYGWFVPFFAAYMFWLRWDDRPAVHVEARVPTRKDLRLRTAAATPFLLSTFHFRLFAAFAFLLLAALLPLRAFEIGNPDWRPLGWIHATIVSGVTLIVIGSWGGKAWLRHFAFPVCFIFVAVPWVSGMETPIIQGLMRSVAAVAAETLNLLGVPAQLEGNLIRVSSGLVGVNEACSGVRSLQTSSMIGLLFGELKRLSLVRRALLLAGALAIALIANCLRALFLVSLAAKNAESIHRWHDIAGYSIVVAVFVGTLAVASLLSRGVDQKSEVRNQTSAPTSDLRPQTSRKLLLSPLAFLVPALAWLLSVECAVESWYRIHERNLIAERRWTVQWPAQSAAFREMEIDEGVRRTLRFDDGREASWLLPAGDRPNESAVRTFAFFFRWNAGGSSVVRARAHRPDICLPSAGWSIQGEESTREYLVGQVPVPFRRSVFRRPGSAATAYAFFCLQEDRRRPNEERPDLAVSGGAQPDWSLVERTRVVRSGIRNLGQQVLEVILVSPTPADPAMIEQEFSALVQTLVRPESSASRS